VSCTYPSIAVTQSADRLVLGIIPLPTIGLRASTSIFATPADRNAARQGLELLNEKAALPPGSSQTLEKALGDLKHVLQPETLTEL
jgi:cohesin loading factor subunit SCC2